MNEPVPPVVDYWPDILAALSAVAGSMVGAGTALWHVAKMTGRIEELEDRVTEHKRLIDTIMTKGDARHEANLGEFRVLGERLAGLPDVIVQRVERLLTKQRI